MHNSDLAQRHAGARRAGAGRLRARLCRRRRVNPSAQPAVDRRHAWHVLRVARACGSAASGARRKIAGLDLGDHERQDADRADADHHVDRHRPGRPCVADALILRRGAARVCKQALGRAADASSERRHICGPVRTRAARAHVHRSARGL